MRQGVLFLIETLFGLYIMIFLLRLILQTVRADFRNPVSQFVLKVTDPLVVPLRRILPAIGPLDTATILIMLVLQCALTATLLYFGCGGISQPLHLLGASVIGLLETTLRIYFWLVLFHVLASWFAAGQYNPLLYVLAQVVEPVLRPFRRFIPPIGGLDLSPVILLVGLQFLMIVLPPLTCRSF